MSHRIRVTASAMHIIPRSTPRMHYDILGHLSYSASSCSSWDGWVSDSTIAKSVAGVKPSCTTAPCRCACDCRVLSPSTQVAQGCGRKDHPQASSCTCHDLPCRSGAWHASAARTPGAGRRGGRPQEPLPLDWRCGCRHPMPAAAWLLWMLQTAQRRALAALLAAPRPRLSHWRGPAC